MTRKAILLLASCMLSGCATHLASTPNRDVTDRTQAIVGTTYTLPMLQFDVTLTRAISACPTLVDISAAKVGGAPLAVGTLELSVKGEGKEHFSRGESYTTDFRELVSPFRTTAFAIETYETGVLKSVNVSADDKTDEVIKEGVKFTLAAAAVAGGGLPGGFLAGAALASGAAGGDAGGAAAAGGRVRAQRAYEDKVKTLFASLPEERMIVCTPEAAAFLATAGAEGKTRRALAAELDKQTKKVQALTAVSRMRAATPTHVQDLAKAYEDQAVAEAELVKAKAGYEDALAEIRTVEVVAWPRAFTDDHEPLNMSADSVRKFRGLLKERTVKVLRRETFRTWYSALTGTEQEAVRQLAKKDPRFGGLFDDAGVIVAEPKVDPNFECKSGVDACIDRAFNTQVYLMRAPTGLRDCPPTGRGPECRTTTAIVELDGKNRTPKSNRTSMLPRGRDARDGQLDKGLFVRDPGQGMLVICRVEFATKPDGETPPCAEPYRVYHSAPTSAPQFGQLRFLPFRTAAFEANEMSVLLREDGSLQKFEVKRTSAAAAKATAAAAEAITQYKAAYDAQEKARKDEPSAIDTQIADLEKKIQLDDLQKKLLKAQTPAAPDQLAAVKEEILTLETETKLDEARLARMKAAEAWQAAQ